MSIPLTALPALVIPGADFPAWAPWAFAAIGLTTVAVLIYQAVRYFRDNPGDDDRGTNSSDNGGSAGGESGAPGTPDEPGTPDRPRNPTGPGDPPRG